MEKAGETRAFYRNKIKEDKALFVKNLGWLLSQTREEIMGCEYVCEQWLDGTTNELVDITFANGYKKRACINLDSYMAIIKDVVRAIER